MKKLPIYLAFLLLPLASSAALFERDLSVGMRGDDVIALQEFLTLHAGYTGPITGYFGPLTQASVKNYQSLKLITPQSGYFGPLTRASANETFGAVINESGAAVSPVAPSKTNDDVVAKLNEQIALLVAQIEELKKVQAEQKAQSQTLVQIQQSQVQPTTPAPEPTPAPVVDKSDLLIESRKIGKTYDFFVNVLDKKGNYVKDATVTMVASHSNFSYSPPKPAGETETSLSGNLNSINVCPLGYCTKPHAYFGYTNETSGAYTMTFASSGLSKTVTIQM